MIPATTLLQRADLEDRLLRGRVHAIVADGAHTAHFEGLAGAPIRIAVGGGNPSWRAFEDSHGADSSRRPSDSTAADALMLLYFTSGTTAKPKLVAHTHTSYPVGHLSTAYWIGLRRGDVHLNLSSPGLGRKARLVLLLCAVECRSHRVGVPISALQCRGVARSNRALPRHDVLRAADRVADVDSGRLATLAGGPPGSRRCG